MAATLAPIKIDPETDALVSHAAHFLGATKKDIVTEAVREYVDRHRAELQRAALDALRSLDGTTRSSVELLTGMDAAQLDELGGFRS